METIQMSINWRDKQNVLYSYHGMLLSHKKEWSSDTCYNMDKLWKQTKWKKPVTHTKNSHTIWFHLHGMSRNDKSIVTTHSSILAWRVLWTEEHGRLQSMGSQRVGHDWAANTTMIESKLIVTRGCGDGGGVGRLG